MKCWNRLWRLFLRQTCELIEQERSLCNTTLNIVLQILAAESIQMQVRVGDVISNTDRHDPRPPAAVTAMISNQHRSLSPCCFDSSQKWGFRRIKWERIRCTCMEEEYGRFQRVIWPMPSRWIWKMDWDCVARPEGIPSGGCRRCGPNPMRVGCNRCTIRSCEQRHSIGNRY